MILCQIQILQNINDIRSTSNDLMTSVDTVSILVYLHMLVEKKAKNEVECVKTSSQVPNNRQ